jgi:hypothetical protein
LGRRGRNEARQRGLKRRSAINKSQLEAALRNDGAKLLEIAMKKLTLFFGVIAIPLGGLWLLQGLGAVQIRPILCFVDCAPIQGASATWTIIGFLMIAAGVVAIFRSRKGRAQD